MNSMFRIIPAYAGQICAPTLPVKLMRDHPRIRGTNYVFEVMLMDFLGSSPHTRDKFHMCMPVLAFPRIIPAYAGQMPCPQGTSKGRRDHPRIRGTNSVFRLIQALLSGSSPHTRDKYPLPKIRPCRSRIIPAYAGQISGCCPE